MNSITLSLDQFNAFLDRVDARLQAGFNNLPAPQVTFPQNVTSTVIRQDGRSLLAEPEKYSGDMSSYLQFKRALIAYISANATHVSLNSDERKILFALSFLRPDTKAGVFAHNYQQQYTTGNVVTLTDTFDQFIVKLDATFDDPSCKAESFAKLHKIRQGNRTAEEFFQEFDLTRIDAEMTDAMHDAMLIHLLETAVHHEVMRSVMRQEATNRNTYDKWKAEACKSDHIERRIRDIERSHKTNMHVPQMPVSTRQQPSAPKQPYRDFQGISVGTHPGMGIPMTISYARKNRLCYFCHDSKHFARDCSKKKEKVKQSIRSMTESARCTIVEVIGELKESDFDSDVEADELEQEDSFTYDA